MPSTSTPSPSEEQPYHHGDLRVALIDATDAILAEGGLEGFSLRAAARRAGVSVAAPAHHFGGASGLLSEVAALGFTALAARLDASGSRAGAMKRLRAQGLAYVRFAHDQPGRFQLMFRRDLLSDEHEGLQAAGALALSHLESTIRLQHGLSQQQPLNTAARDGLLAAWSIVHGFAHLLLDGKLTHMNGGASSDELLERVLPRMLLSQWPG